MYEKRLRELLCHVVQPWHGGQIRLLMDKALSKWIWLWS